MIELVVGELTPSLLTLMRPELDVGFGNFETPTVQGMARVRGDRLDVLVVAAKRERRGDVSAFLAECCRVYKTVYVLEVWNPVLEGMLQRRGFEKVRQYMDGELTDGYRWTR